GGGRLGRHIRATATATVAIVLVLNLPPFTPFQERDRHGDLGWLTQVTHEIPLGVVFGGESRDAFLARTVRTYRAWQWSNTHVPPTARVLTFSTGDTLYSDRDRLWSDATSARPATWG